MNTNHDATVSKQWAKRPADERFLNLASLQAAVAKRREHSQEIRESLGELAVILNEDGDDLRLALPGLDSPAEMTHYSFGSLCSRVGAPAGFFRNSLAHAPELAAECLNECITRADNEPIMPYVYRNGRTELRAATSPSYGRIYDADVVSAVARMNERDDNRWKVPGVLDWGTGIYNPHVDVTQETTTLYASDRDIFLFMVDDLNPIKVGTLDNGNDDLMFRGFYVWNSETGNASFGMACMYLRAVCANRILWGVEQKKEITFRHSQNAPGRFLREARPMLANFAQANTAAVVAGVEAAKAPVLPDERKDKIAWIMKHANVTQVRAVAALNAVEREEHRICRSVWDVAQGLTAVARRIPHQDQRVDLERAAKRILDKVA
jgi:hypothetical protein